ncbi:MAG TPA: hypothetical protein VN816_06200 [Acidimicrobiales bacterium]|nr:hypothetical protein [Acidimicrobiales bacterium]
MATPAETLTFTPDHPDAVVARMDRLASAHHGWINITPLVREEDEPPPQMGLSTLFSGPAHDVPVCTWVPGKAGRKGIEPDSLGIQHNAGTKTVALLATLGVPVPPGWRREQDHPRRGLVLRVPAGVARSEQLSWLLDAATHLSRVPLTGRWEARVRAGR